ncbi:hypothetical protein SM82_02219 [Klebsiella pneumoniae]|nr:hypothetical protein SM82_02219 [Klebsiella pneumoniae]
MSAERIPTATGTTTLPHFQRALSSSLSKRLSIAAINSLLRLAISNLSSLFVLDIPDRRSKISAFRSPLSSDKSAFVTNCSERSVNRTRSSLTADMPSSSLSTRFSRLSVTLPPPPPPRLSILSGHSLSVVEENKSWTLVSRIRSPGFILQGPEPIKHHLGSIHGQVSTILTVYHVVRFLNVSGMIISF